MVKGACNKFNTILVQFSLMSTRGAKQLLETILYNWWGTNISSNVIEILKKKKKKGGSGVTQLVEITLHDWWNTNTYTSGRSITY